MKAFMVLIAALTIASAVFAQVSPPAPLPTLALSVSITGKITKVEISSSSVNLYVDAVVSENDKPETWGIETGSLNELSEKGISRTNLKFGRSVKARGTLGTGKNRLIAPVSEISFPQ